MAPLNNKWLSAIRLMIKQRNLLSKETITLVGKDDRGNAYYESYKPNHSRKLQRHFENENVTTDLCVADLAHVPPAWDSWLKFKRIDPPSEEELKDSDTYYKMQQEMAAKRKAEEMQKHQDEGTVSSQLSKKREFPKIYNLTPPHRNKLNS